MPIGSRWLSLLSHNVSLSLDELNVAIQWGTWSDVIYKGRRLNVMMVITLCIIIPLCVFLQFRDVTLATPKIQMYPDGDRICNLRVTIGGYRINGPVDGPHGLTSFDRPRGLAGVHRSGH